MAALFLKLFNRSLAAGWLILAVIVLRFLLKRAPKWIHCTLWVLVAVRLLCPISIQSVLSLIPSSEPLPPEAVQYAAHPAIHSGVTALDNAVNPVIGEVFAASPEVGVNPLYVWTEIAGIVWVIGAAALLVYAAVSYLRLRRTVFESAPLWDNIYLCDHIPAPFILGIVRPRVYLPSDLRDEQMQSVVAHERAHLARRDHWWKPLGWALLTVYWFNPLCWAAYILLCRDIELACDEKVIRDMDADDRKAYSQVLLSCSIPRRLVSPCPLAFGEVGVKERIRGVLNYRKPAFWVIAAAVIACAAAAVCFLTDPKDEHKAESVTPAGLSAEEWNAILSKAEPYSPQNIAIDPVIVSVDSAGEILCDRALPSGIRIVCYCEPGSEYVKYWAVRNGDSLTRFCQEESGYREGYDVEPFSDVLGRQSGFRILAPRGAAYVACDYYVVGKNGVPQILAECTDQVEEVDLNNDGETDLRWYYHGDQEVYYCFRQNGQLYISGSASPIAMEPATFELMELSAFYADELTMPNFTTRTYYTQGADGIACPIAESFGFEINDYVVDLDGDGVTELVCNCQYGGDGHESVFVFRRNGNVIERGWLDLENKQLDMVMPNNWRNWGVNSTAERYNPDTGMFEVRYDTDHGPETATVSHLSHFTFEEYVRLPEGTSPTPITAENLFASMPSTFHFLSGAGGWQTELYWYGNGKFSGIFEDADVGSIARCEFVGTVSAPVKISDLVYSAHVTKLNYDKPGITTKENGIPVTTSGPYGLDDADELRIYLPGYPVSLLPEEAVNWLRGGVEEFWDGKGPQYLACFVLYNVNGQQAFFSADWSAFSQ